MADEHLPSRALRRDDARVRANRDTGLHTTAGQLRSLQQPHRKVLHAMEPVVILLPRVVPVYHWPAARKFLPEPVAQPHLAQVPRAAPRRVRGSSKPCDGNYAIAPPSVNTLVVLPVGDETYLPWIIRFNGV